MLNLFLGNLKGNSLLWSQCRSLFPYLLRSLLISLRYPLYLRCFDYPTYFFWLPLNTSMRKKTRARSLVPIVKFSLPWTISVIPKMSNIPLGSALQWAVRIGNKGVARKALMAQPLPITKVERSEWSPTTDLPSIVFHIGRTKMVFQTSTTWSLRLDVVTS